MAQHHLRGFNARNAFSLAQKTQFLLARFKDADISSSASVSLYTLQRPHSIIMCPGCDGGVRETWAMLRWWLSDRFTYILIVIFNIGSYT